MTAYLQLPNAVLPAIAIAGLASLLAAGGCTPTSDTLPLSVNDDSVALEIVYDEDPDSTVIATIAEPEGKLAITIHGAKAEDGSIEDITEISGTTADGTAFTASFAEGTPLALDLPTIDLEFEAVDETTFNVTVTETPVVPEGYPIVYQDALVSPRIADRSFVIEDERDDCDSRERRVLLGGMGFDYLCPTNVHRDLEMLMPLVGLQTYTNALYDTGCITEDKYSAASCMALLALVDSLGQVLTRIVAANPNLPAAVRALCFDLVGECPSGGSTGTGGSTSGDGSGTGGSGDGSGGTDPDAGDSADGDADADNTTGGICGSYPADGSGLLNRIVVYGAFDIYWGEPVADSDVPIYAGHYVGYSADGFYYSANNLNPDDVAITWDIEGSEAALVTGTQKLNNIYVHALAAGTIQLCVQGVWKETGDVIGYLAVPITILEPPFFIDTVEVSRPEYATPSNVIFLLLGYEGQVSFPVTAYVETVGASCPPETGELPCETEYQDGGDTSYTNVVSIYMDLTDRCAEVGTGGTLYYRLYMSDAAGAYSRPLDYTYTCIPNP